MFGMLSWNQKPLWADSCHICLFGQMRERSSAAFCRGAGGRLGGVRGCAGICLGLPPCPCCAPQCRGLSRPGAGPAPRRPVLACCTLSWSNLSRGKQRAPSEVSVRAELRGACGGSLAERGRGGCRVLLLAGL